MSITNSSASYKLRSLVKLLHHYRVCSTSWSTQEINHCESLPMIRHGGGVHDGLRLISANYGGVSRKAASDRVKDEDSKGQGEPSGPAPLKPGFPAWAKWLLGSMLSLVLPLWNQKWAKLLSFEAKVEQVMEEVETVVDVVEKVATTAEKVSVEVADKLPVDGKLKEAALFVEHLSEETAKDAELTKDFIHKVEVLKHDLTDLGTLVEPVVDKIIAKEHADKSQN
ncbi:hypothetical protein NMG60_11032704 [Bertholletia excelsa]